jgi:hypothetical protein
MRVTLFLAALIFFSSVQAAIGSVYLVSSDSVEIKISQNDSLYKEVLRLHTRADELNKMLTADIELRAILLAELARTQQMKKIILGGLDLSFSEFAAKVSLRLMRMLSVFSAEREQLMRQNEKIENRLRRKSKQRILLKIGHRNRLTGLTMCDVDHVLEWSVCFSPYHDFDSYPIVTLTASNATVDRAIEQIRLNQKKNKIARTVGAVVGVAISGVILVPAVYYGILLSGL